jgi:hypothetical protein
MQPAQLGQCQPGLFDCRTNDFIADGSRTRITQEQMKRTGAAVEAGVVARRDRTVQVRHNLGVEPHFAFVETQRKTGLPAHRIGGRDLEHDRVRTRIPSA